MKYQVFPVYSLSEWLIFDSLTITSIIYYSDVAIYYKESVPNTTVSQMVGITGCYCTAKVVRNYKLENTNTLYMSCI